MTLAIVLVLAIGCTFCAVVVAFAPSALRLDARGRAVPRQPPAAVDPAPDAQLEGASPQAASPEAASPDVPALTEPEVWAKLHALALGADVSPGGAAEHGEQVAALGTVIESGTIESRYVPRRPMLLPRLLQAMNDSETSWRELAAIIVRDPALVGNVLRLANSPLYRVSPRPIESVERAIVQLGTEGIRSVVAAAVIQPVFRVADERFARFPHVTWDHTFRAAAAAEAHGAFVEKTDRFAAQLLGLLMGLGTIVVFTVLRDRLRRSGRKGPSAALVAAAIDAHAAAAARRIAQSWDLSPRILTTLDGEIPGKAPPQEVDGLARSLRFGRLVGALAVLQTNALIDAETARRSLPSDFGPERIVDSIWARISVVQ
ncbi:MAG TPA: HDOD domain-containing protein [Gammaproteobacteria bacterium]